MLIVAEMATWMVGVLVALFVVISAMLILVVLVQKPQGGGLSEAFGSSGGAGATAFGAKTGDALTTATIGIFVVFIACAIGLNFAVRPPEAVEASIGADPNQPADSEQGAPAGGAPPRMVQVQPSQIQTVPVEPAPVQAAPGQPAAPAAGSSEAPAPSGASSGTAGTTPPADAKPKDRPQNPG